MTDTTAALGAEGILDCLTQLVPTTERWPLLRLGDREPIHPTVRALIFERDGGRCIACGIRLTLRTAQLDHIIPWSAYGPDASWNLRILCEPCNYDRSNFRGTLDDTAARRVPVSMCCAECALIDVDDYELDYEDVDEFDDVELRDLFAVTPEMVSAFCGNCGVVSKTWPGETF